MPKRTMVLCFALLAVAWNHGQEKEESQKVEIPGIEVDLEARRLVMEGFIALPRGLIELVACTDYGKTHESICALKVDPVDFKAALLLLGLKESPQVKHLGERKALEGDKVIIYLEWEVEGKTVRHRAEKLIINRRTGKTMKEVGWVFTGSRFVKQEVYVPGKDDETEMKEFFMASETGSLVTTFHDPNSILDNPLEDGGDDTLYHANHKVLPPRKTPIRFIVEAPEKKADEKKDE